MLQVRFRGEVDSLIKRMVTARCAFGLRCPGGSGCVSSPGSTEERLRGDLSYNPDDTVESWDLSSCGLTALPEEFGALELTGNLFLNNNQIESLPESFGNLRVGGNLWLTANQIESLPQSFANLTVGGVLGLKNFGDVMGPALDQARALEYRNVKGNVYK